MTAYESRIRAWAMNRGMKDYLTAKIDKVEEYMHKTGHIAEFYEAFPDYDPNCEVEMVMNTDRKKVLENCTQIYCLTKEYDGTEGFLGENFCEDRLGMSKAPRGMKDVDGLIGDSSVQIKFKWINDENFKSRYVTINPNAKFDLLIVTCADYGDTEVCLFGIWEERIVKPIIGARKRVYLKKLLKQDQAIEFIPKNLNSKTDEELIVYCADIESVAKNKLVKKRLVLN